MVGSPILKSATNMSNIKVNIFLLFGFVFLISSISVLITSKVALLNKTVKPGNLSFLLFFLFQVELGQTDLLLLLIVPRES
jgi:hypothetical protein